MIPLSGGLFILPIVFKAIQHADESELVNNLAPKKREERRRRKKGEEGRRKKEEGKKKIWKYLH